MDNVAQDQDMTIEDVRKELDHIRDIAMDDEAAHCCEDDLFRTVLQAIADGVCVDPAGVARETLTVSSIEFRRWHA